MILKDYHMHTTYCDGADSPREMALSAIEKGFESIGFSVHSYTKFDESYCIKKEKIESYKKEIHALKEEFKDKIEILCGVEKDFYSDTETDGFDYVIGSVHYLFLGDEYIPVDESFEILKKAAEKYFGGDLYAIAEEYFKTVGDVAEKTKADIIGHFDLITKFNEKTPAFDEMNDRYLKAAFAAADKLLKADIPFEINTGAISRGYRTSPYPSAVLTDYISQNGGRFIMSSDAHSRDAIGFQFEKWTPNTMQIQKSFKC